MSHNIHHFVITGGPQSGQTTALAFIQQRLIALGYQVLVCPDACVTLMQGGIHPKSLGTIVFEDLILEIRKHQEETFTRIAEMLAQNGPVVILHNRGILDGKAYTNHASWLINKAEEAKLQSRYDAVVHLVTAAKGADAFYVLASDVSIKEACAMDQRLQDAWAKHPCLFIVDNGLPFDKKIAKAAWHILKFFGLPEPIVSKKTYLINEKQEGLETFLRFYNIPFMRMDISEHAYERCGIQNRLRKKRTKSSSAHYLSINKRFGERPIRTDTCISCQDYARHLANLPDEYVVEKKTRFCFVEAGIYHEVDFSNGPMSEHGILRVETDDMAYAPNHCLFKEHQEMS